MSLLRVRFLILRRLLQEELRGREYYHPNDRGYEHEVSQRLDKVRSILHSETAPDGYTESKEQNG